MTRIDDAQKCIHELLPAGKSESTQYARFDHFITNKLLLEDPKINLITPLKAIFLIARHRYMRALWKYSGKQSGSPDPVHRNGRALLRPVLLAIYKPFHRCFQRWCPLGIIILHKPIITLL
jgi:hypothetical protein